MNYKNIYNNLMSKRANNTISEGYFETHHIIPKCINGDNSSSNLVRLTAREHYLAHWLLTKIHPNNDKLLFAFSLMDGSLSPLAERCFTSRAYERCKKAKSEAMKLRMNDPNYANPMKSEKLKSYFSNLLKGDNNPNRKFPERNRTAYPVTVVYNDGKQLHFPYGKKAAEELGISYATWKYASRKNKGIPSQGITKIIKHHKPSQQPSCEG